MLIIPYIETVAVHCLIYAKIHLNNWKDSKTTKTLTTGGQPLKFTSESPNGVQSITNSE